MLENFSYFGLFLISFISATLYPLGSEAFVVGFLYNGFSPMLVLCIASLGNTLGSMSTYLIAFLGENYLLEKYYKKALEKLKKFQLNIYKFGAFYAFFTFLPFIGDIFALALGIARYPFLKALFFIALGKTLRYAILVFVTLHYI